MLTEQELNRIFSWQPYREDWPIDRNQVIDNIDLYYGDLIKDLTKNKMFETYFSEDGGLANYLEFICYPAADDTYEGNAIMVCVSLCAPVTAYGQTRLKIEKNFIGSSGLFRPEQTCQISDPALTEIEKEIKKILADQNLILLDAEFAAMPVPGEIAEGLQENLNEGKQYLHVIFQKTD